MRIEEIHRIESDMIHEVHDILTRHNIPYCACFGTLLGTIRHKGPIPWDPDSDLFIYWKDFEHALDILKAELSDRFCIHWNNSPKGYDFLLARVAYKGKGSEILHVDLFPLVKYSPDTNRLFLSGHKTFARQAKYYHLRVKTLKSVKNIFLRGLFAFIKLFGLGISSEKMFAEFKSDLDYTLDLPGDKYYCPWEQDEIFDDLLSDIQEAEYDNGKIMIPASWETFLTKNYGNWKELPKESYREHCINRDYWVRDL